MKLETKRFTVYEVSDKFTCDVIIGLNIQAENENRFIFVRYHFGHL